MRGGKRYQGRVMRCWLPTKSWGLALGAAAKCGSTSLREAVLDNGQNHLAYGKPAQNHRTDFSEIRKHFRTIGVVRHPVERFYSLYSNVQERFEGRSDQNFYKQFEGERPGELFEAILADPDKDFHFQPQHRIGLGDADEVIRLEDLSTWWSYVLPDAKPIKDLNSSEYTWRSPASRDTRLEAEICELYSTDLILWEGAEWQDSPKSS